MKRIAGRYALITGQTVLLLLLAIIHAQGQRYPFHNLNVDDGLVQSQVTSLAQDKTGNLWIGTLGGLSRYDGRSFTNYTIKNGLPGNSVWALAADSANNVWIAGVATLSCFDGKKFTHYNALHLAERGAGNAQQIQIVHDTVWWRVAGDIYFIANGKLNLFNAPGMPDYASAMLAEKDGIWVGGRGMVYHRREGKTDTLKPASAYAEAMPYVYSIFRDDSSQVWVATNSGLFKVVNNQLTVHPLPNDTISIHVFTSLCQDKAGAIWAGTNKGVFRINGKITQYYNKHNGLSDNVFLDMFTDAEGNVWMGSDGQGVFRFSGTWFTGLDETMGLPSAQVSAIASNRRDSLFLGTYDAGLFIFSGGKISPLSFPSPPVPSITALCYAHSRLWIGTRGRGLWTYEHGIFRQYEAPERGFPSNYIHGLYEDPANRMWIGFSNGAILFERDTFKTVPVKSGPVVSFLSIGNDSVLMVVNDKLQLYSAGTITDFITNTVADSFSIECLILQGRDIWLGTSENGVIRYNMDNHDALVINKNTGLRSDFIYDIVADKNGDIWAGTGFGIHRIKMVARDSPKVTFFGKDKGITGMESNTNAVLRLADGSIWFGTTNGAFRYEANAAVISTGPASIVLQSVKLPGENAIDNNYYDSTDKWYGIPYHLRLPYKKNSITFTFQAIMLSGVQQVLYRYRMDGIDVPWSDWSANNSVSYTALPPGVYTLHVQCQSGDEQTYPELAYTFEIITPFQKTNWFRLSVLGACILLGIFMQYIAGSRKQRRMRLRHKLRAEEQAKIRLRTAEDFHDEIGNRLTRINVLASVLKNKINLTPETTRILGQIEENTAQLYSGTRDILWSLKPSNDNLYEILNRIRDFGTELFQDTDVQFTVNDIEEQWQTIKLPMDVSRNMIMIFKEALNNCLKYAHARNVSIDVTLRKRGVLQMILRDDGNGFDQHTIKKGNGINNMQIRAMRMNGKLYVDSWPGKGTIITLTFKVTKPK